MKKFLNLANRIMNCLSYIAFLVISMVLVFLIVSHTPTIYHLAAYILLFVGVTGILIIEFKGFIAKGRNWREVYPPVSHGPIQITSTILGAFTFIGLFLWIFAEKPVILWSTVGFSLLFYIVAVVAWITLSLAGASVALLMTGYGLNKYNNHLDKKIERLDEESKIETGGNE